MNTNEEVRAYLSSLSTIDLQQSLATAVVDLREAAEKETDLEWHESCFAAVILYSQEISRRNIYQ